MRIHTEQNGAVYVNAISVINGGCVDGHVYQLQANDAQVELRFQLGRFFPSRDGVWTTIVRAILNGRKTQTRRVDANEECAL